MNWNIQTRLSILKLIINNDVLKKKEYIILFIIFFNKILQYYDINFKKITYKGRLLKKKNW